MKILSIVLGALVLFIATGLVAQADTIEDREQNYQDQQQQAREKADLDRLARQRQLAVQGVKSFAARHSGLVSDPICTVQMAGTEVGTDTQVPMSAVLTPNVVWINSCAVYLKNGLDCNVVPDLPGFKTRSGVTAGCYDAHSNYREMH